MSEEVEISYVGIRHRGWSAKCDEHPDDDLGIFGDPDDAMEELVNHIRKAHDYEDVANLARRTCHCGLRVDGFYEYVEHLLELLREEQA